MSRLLFGLLCLYPFLASGGEIGEAVGFHAPVKNDYQEPEQVGEQALTLPAFPDNADLIEFYAGPRASNHFFVDPKSLSAGTDGIVRFTLVIKTSGGATNINYEGIRCASREVRVYAAGNANGTWAVNHLTSWRPIENELINGYHAALNRDLFCPLGNPIRSAAEGLNALRRGKHPLVP